MSKPPESGDVMPEFHDLDWAGARRGVHRPKDVVAEKDFTPPAGPAGVEKDDEQATD